MVLIFYQSNANKSGKHFSQDPNKELTFESGHLVGELEYTNTLATDGNQSWLKRSHSTSAFVVQRDTERTFTGEHEGAII